MKAALQTLTLGLLLSTSLQAGQTDFGGGSAGARWLNINTSVRSAGMGGGTSALSGLDTQSLNPAGLASLGGAQASLGHSILVQDASLEHLGAGYSPMAGTGAALGFDYVRMGTVDGFTVDSTNALVPVSYSPYAYALNLGAGHDFGMGVAGGLNLKYINQNLDGTGASTFAADLGAQYKLEGTGFTGAASISDLGGTLSGSSLASLIRIGGAYAFGEELPLTLAADLAFDRSYSSSQQLRIGGEYIVQNALGLRAGYHYDGADQTASGVSFGAGIKYDWLNVDYAMTVVPNAISSLHQISLTATLP